MTILKVIWQDWPLKDWPSILSKYQRINLLATAMQSANQWAYKYSDGANEVRMKLLSIVYVRPHTLAVNLLRRTLYLSMSHITTYYHFILVHCSYVTDHLYSTESLILNVQIQLPHHVSKFILLQISRTDHSRPP